MVHPTRPVWTTCYIKTQHELWGMFPETAQAVLIMWLLATKWVVGNHVCNKVTAANEHCRVHLWLFMPWNCCIFCFTLVFSLVALHSPWMLRLPLLVPQALSNVHDTIALTDHMQRLSPYSSIGIPRKQKAYFQSSTLLRMFHRTCRCRFISTLYSLYSFQARNWS